VLRIEIKDLLNFSHFKIFLLNWYKMLCCSSFFCRFSYEPEPDAEEELNIQAGDYLLVWGEPVGPGGYLDAELLDGRRGLVPSHFVQRLIGDDLLEFHQAVLSTLREEEINQENFAADVQRLNEMAEMSETHDDDGPEGEQGRLLHEYLGCIVF
jgi:hypothetical protein